MVVEQDTDAVSIKRVGDDSAESDARASKRVRVDSADPDVALTGDDLLKFLDDDPDAVSAPENTDLDSVMRSFEEEILHPPAPESSEPGDAQPDLGYLLEASDDELGLPPAVSPVVEDELPRYDSFGFQDEVPGYDPFGFGFGEETGDTGYGHFETVGEGLFEYPEEPEFSEYLWRPESLPAA